MDKYIENFIYRYNPDKILYEKSDNPDSFVFRKGDKIVSLEYDKLPRKLRLQCKNFEVIPDTKLSNNQMLSNITDELVLTLPRGGLKIILWNVENMTILEFYKKYYRTILTNGNDELLIADKNKIVKIKNVDCTDFEPLMCDNLPETSILLELYDRKIDDYVEDGIVFKTPTKMFWIKYTKDDVYKLSEIN